MQKINLPKRPTELPKTSALREYRLNNGKAVRIIIEMSNETVDSNGMPVPPGNVLLYSQGYEMTDEGDFVAAPNGYPSRTPRTPTVVPRSAIGDTSRLSAGWVRYVPPVDQPISVDTMPEGSFVGDALPATAEVGQIAYVGGQFYQWDEGLTEKIARGKAQEMENITNNSLVLSGLELD